MYIRIKNVPKGDGTKRQYLCLVESKWVNGKVKQRNVATLGKLEDLQEGDTLENIARKIAEFVEGLAVVKGESDFSIQESKEFGMLGIYQKIWKDLKIGEILDRHFEKKKMNFSVSEALFAMVSHRLMHPGSKKDASEWMKTVYEPKWEGLALHHLYRSLDYLADKKETFECELFQTVKESFNEPIDIVMFDTTSVMSWGEGESSLLLKHGHSKEKRPDLRQIMVGVLMTKDGMPIGHEVWEGNQSDKKSFVQVIGKVKEKFKLDKVILVGDRGMISSKNIEALDEAGYAYILGLPMRKLDQEKREILLGWNREKLVSEIPEFEIVKATESGKLYAKDVTLMNEKTGLNQRYIVCFNPEEAQYRAKQREYFKEMILKKAASTTVKEWVVKNGYRKYVTIKGRDGKEAVIKIDEDKIEKEAIYDGKWILTTNTQLDGKGIAKAYKGLSQIEQAFRELKSNLEIGPMFHWTTKRIRAHVFICFLALILEIVFKRKLRNFDPFLNPSDVVADVEKIHANFISLNGKSAVVRTELSGLASKAFQALSLKVPNKFLKPIS